MCKNYNEYYNETQYEQSFGESEDRNELVTKLTEIYDELTKNPHSLDNGYDSRASNRKQGWGNDIEGWNDDSTIDTDYLGICSYKPNDDFITKNGYGFTHIKFS